MKNPEREKIKKENTNRVILNVPKEIDEKFQELSIKRGLAKSHMILFAMSWYLDYSNSLDLMPKMIDALKNIPNNEISNIDKGNQN